MNSEEVVKEVLASLALENFVVSKEVIEEILKKYELTRKRIKRK